MSNLENVKNQLLEFIASLSDTTMENVPAVYFCKELYKKLVNEADFSVEDASKIVGAIDVNFSGLGLDYKPHQKWLDKMVIHTFKIISNVWNVCRKEIGKDYALKTIAGMDLYIKG